jgi:hypothetical protein
MSDLGPLRAQKRAYIKIHRERTGAPSRAVIIRKAPAFLKRSQDVFPTFRLQRGPIPTKPTNTPEAAALEPA